MAEAAPELLTGVADFAAHAAQIVSTAHTELAVLTQELDRRIYGGAAFAESLRHFVLQHAHTKVRVLVNATQRAVANSPRLVELGRALTTFIEFRELLPARQQVIREECVIGDGRAMVYRESPQDLEFKYYGAHPLAVRMKLKEFQTLWDESVPAQELRRLGA
jgi:hypothetical protein